MPTLEGIPSTLAGFGTAAFVVAVAEALAEVSPAVPRTVTADGVVDVDAVLPAEHPAIASTATIAATTSRLLRITPLPSYLWYGSPLLIRNAR
jgi:hypothetical protein